jgi:hypothetical protein
MVYTFLAGILFIACISTHDIRAWSQTYTIQPLLKSVITEKNKDFYAVERTSLTPFTQLIFSWNAYRPEKGYFSFWVQGQDNSTGLWSSWHKMMVWGNGIQCSYISVPDTIAEHVHVRFEARHGKKCSGFRIKIEAHEGADLCCIQSITVNCADFTKFKAENAQDIMYEKSVHIHGIPRKSQWRVRHPEKHRLCSPTSCAMILESLTKRKCDPAAFASFIYDAGLDSYGSWPFNTAYAFERSKGKYWYSVVRYTSFGDIYKQLLRGLPVVVSVRGMLQGAPKTYDSGHLLVVVGYDVKARAVICHDPAFERNSQTLHRYSLHNFLQAWEASRRLAYHIELSPICF